MTLNEAIYMVLTTQYKKDAREAHKIVESAGYIINKNNGYFEVYNPKLNKRVHITRNFYSYRHHCGMLNVWCGIKACEMTYEKLEKVDFVGMLNTPRNEEYYRELKWKTINRNRREELISCKWNIKYYGDAIDDIKHKIESAQKELIFAVERKTKAIQKLEKIKETINRR